MKTICMAAVLAALLLTGCAAGSGPRDDEDLLIRCRAQADQFHKGRYNTEWNLAVEKCLEEHRAD
ncbi:hypothetical protein [Desulfocurvus sp. DL9XJH121]